jgi:hypothetical protein
MLRCLLWLIAAAIRPNVLLVADNLCLRQQLVVLQRRKPRPRLEEADRCFWILACRWFSEWRTSLLIVKPETVLRWHRQGWRAYWRRRSRRTGRPGRRAIAPELRVPHPPDDDGEPTYMSARHVKSPTPLFSFLSFFPVPFFCLTAPQAFSRPDRVLSQAGAHRCCQGWPALQRPHPSPGCLGLYSNRARRQA